MIKNCSKKKYDYGSENCDKNLIFVPLISSKFLIPILFYHSSHYGFVKASFYGQYFLESI